MPYYDIANLVTLTETNLIHEMPCGYGTLRTTAVRIWHSVSLGAAQRSQLLSKSPTVMGRCCSCSIISLSYKSYIVLSWIHIHNCRCFQEHLRMLLESLGALYFTAGGPGSICNYMGALEMLTRVPARSGCGFQTNLQLADALPSSPLPSSPLILSPSPSLPWALERMLKHIPTTCGEGVVDSPVKSESEICSPEDVIVYLPSRM